MHGLDDARLVALVRDKLGVPEPLINQFRRLAEASRRPLEEMIIEMGLTSPEQLASLIAQAEDEARAAAGTPRTLDSEETTPVGDLSDDGLDSLESGSPFAYDSLPAAGLDSGGPSPFRVVPLDDDSLAGGAPRPARPLTGPLGPSAGDVFDSVGPDDSAEATEAVDSAEGPDDSDAHRSERDSDTPTLMRVRDPGDSAAGSAETDDLPWATGSERPSSIGRGGADLPFHVDVSQAPSVGGDRLESDLRALLDDDHFLFGEAAREALNDTARLTADDAADVSDPFAVRDLPPGPDDLDGDDPLDEADPAGADEADDPFAAYRAFGGDDEFDDIPGALPVGRIRPQSGALPRIEHARGGDDLLVSDHAQKGRAPSPDDDSLPVDYDPLLDSRPPSGDLAPLPGRAVPLDRGPAPEAPRPRRERRSDVLPTLHTSATRYELGEPIAQGGMGRVIEARDLNIDRTVAMKLLIKGKDEQLGMQLRFTEEAQITGQLQHPNIVPVYDLGAHKDGQLYFTMKLVRGRTLRDVLKALRRGDDETEQAFTRTRLLASFQQVCMGIAYAHSRNVVHRDLKPSNIMFGDFGEILVMDWGLAKILRRRTDVDGNVSSHRMGMSRWATRHGEVIGTPGYMPPELALGNLDEVDERSDVYSLGAILYEILTLRPPYTGRDARAIIRKMLRERVVPPRKRAPARNIPAELEEICMRCLAKDIDQRYPSVLELHGALQAFLEGAMEQERQRKEAARHTRTARGHVDDYRAHTRAVERLMAEVEDHRLRLAPWAGAERRRALWDAQQRLDLARRERVESFTRAAQSFRQALVCNPEDADAREGLCQLYWGGFLQSEHEGDHAAMVQYETVLRAVDTGNYAELLRGDGRLQVETDPPGARAVLFDYAEIDKILTPQNPRDLGRTPVVVDPLPMGSYLLVLRAPGLRDTQVPVRIERLGETHLVVRLRTDRALGAGFVYIPGGQMTIGGDRHASWGLPRQTVEVADFCLSRLPVSGRQYLDFLNALATTDLEQARRRAPRLFAGGGMLFDEAGGRFRIPERDPNGIPWDPNWPVFGVSFDDALAYCRWRSALDGVRYRLPTEIEWEVAARGADLRCFPWGDTWEPTYCKSAHARPGAAHLEPCGSFPTDRSPYGVMDLAGGVSDWTVSPAGSEGEHADRICRGGSWNHLDLHARAASRHAMAPAAVSVSVGFRLARDP